MSEPFCPWCKLHPASWHKRLPSGATFCAGALDVDRECDCTHTEEEIVEATK